MIALLICGVVMAYIIGYWHGWKSEGMTTSRIDYSPDRRSAKKGVMFSRYTGGAYADAQEVIEDELARIQRSRAGYSADAETRSP